MQPISDFKSALNDLHALLPRLGDTPEEQADILSLLAGIVGRRITKKDIKAPEVAPEEPPPVRLPHYPQPADFQAETLIGHFAGAPVIGLAIWDDEAGKPQHDDVWVELDDLTIWCDKERIHVEDGAYEGWKLETFGRLVELRQMGELDRLLTMARRWCK